MTRSGKDGMQFPIAMTPFEEYMHGDDHRAYPMRFFVRLRFTGKIDRPAFERAFQTAIGRHILLTSTLKESRDSGLCWSDSSDAPVEIRWLAMSDSFPPPFDHDLRDSPGLGLSILCDDQACEMVVQFHHACCDGLGAFGFIEDLLIAYAIQRGEAADSLALPPLEPQRLAHRNRFDFSWPKLSKMIPKQAVGLLGVRQFLMRRPGSLSDSEPVELDQPPPAEYPCVNVLRLDPVTVQTIRDTARRHNVTVNHLFASDLFLAIDDWRSRYMVDAEDRWIRFSMPINVRTEKDRSLPAANKVSMVFLDRRREHFSKPLELLHSIRDEMQLIARNRLEFIFLLSLWITKKIRGNAMSAAKTDRCHATTLLTNVGSPFARTPLPKQSGKMVVGNLQLESLDIVPPLRPYTDVAFSICQYAGSYHVTMHWDQRAITQNQATELLSMYQRRLCSPSYG